MAIFGVNESRLAILLFLARHPASTKKEICDATELRAPSVTVHLRALVEAGALLTDPVTPSSGQRVYYRVHTAIIAAELRELTAGLIVE